MGSTAQPLRIAIVGGGIGGLALAAGLCKKPHLDVHVYEGVSGYRDVGAGLALHLNAMKAMSLIGPEVRQAYLDKATDMADAAADSGEEEMATEVILAHGPHAGELVAELGRAKGRKSVSRADLLAGLLALIPPGHVSLGKKLARIVERPAGTAAEPDEEPVVLEFHDGSQAAADCVLGADGIHSVVRSHLLGAGHAATAPKNHDRWQVYRTLVTTDEALRHINEKWTRRVPILLGPRGHVNCIPVSKGTRVSAGVAVRGGATPKTSADGPGGGAGGQSNNKTEALDPALYADYSADAQRIVGMVARNTNASWSVGDHDHAPHYWRGRVAMLGDAAHAALPFAGNGAAQALEDAAVLDHLFGSVGGRTQIAAALAAYDAVRRPRSQQVVDLARRFGRVYAYADDEIGDDPARMRAFFAEAAAFTNNADLERQNREAMDLYEHAVGEASRSGKA
ncbi:hypothetical protein B0T26DRAFT_742107 [Lasiosphaeria miniovina]|uniref:FAD-binding domain-containing protein n=1 Tax=Lasiosphaeria miniovina TaxID=1954250 RepID=A0AA40ACI6_9PEZI|nr:uncharacterized protein B0T26DRAFT_742107 [Lasiosphaeria miniovina]KAK0713369.1 hypothetical protein B0T26DRAFT_742107 [Lasiosphaeria miniovina]